MSHSTACAHCSETDDHVHLDSREHAHNRRRQLLTLAGLRAVIIVAVLTASALALQFLPLLAGLALWAVSTAAGVLTSTLLLTRVGRLRALMFGALVAAAVTPALAAVLSRLEPGDWTFALAAAAGYLTGSFGAEAVRLWSLRTLLGADTRAGEVARDSAAITHDQDRDGTDLLASAAMAALVGGYVYLTGLLTVLVVVLVPLHLAIVALRRRQSLRQVPTPRVATPQRADS